MPNLEDAVPGEGRGGEDRHRQLRAGGGQTRVLDRIVRLVLQRQDRDHRRRKAAVGAVRDQLDRGGE